MNSANDINIENLNLYLKQHARQIGQVEALKKFNTGQSNPTYLLTSQSGKFVLRAKPPGKLLKSAHQVDREFRVMAALANTKVPVPKMLHLCDDAQSPIGRMFMIMEHIDGRIFWDPAVPEVDSNGDRSAIYNAMNTTLADLHSVDVEAVGLSDFGKPGSYYERQIDRWTKQYYASKIDEIPAMDKLIKWLENNQPEDDGQVSIVHGDYRIDNMIFSNEGGENLNILAVLDWELSTLGHPLADLAYQCMQWRLPNQGDMRGLAGIDRKAAGIPTEQEYVDRYCARRGIEQIDNWSFYLAFCFFRLAAIIQGVGKRALDGNASNAEKGARMAKAVPLLAGAAIDIIEKET